MDERLEQAMQICPQIIRENVLQLAQSANLSIEEIRLRTGKPPSVFANGREWKLQCDGASVPITQQTVAQVVARAAEFSVYAAQEQLARGFCTVCGGHRLGICGEAVTDHEKITTLKNFSSVNLRVAHEIRGSADKITDLIWAHPGSLLLLGPPGCGKTTVLRDAVRQLSDRLHSTVGLVDERWEVAACVDGVPQFDVGGMTDILSGAFKEAAVPMLVRTMRPEWIALDEITQQADVRALAEASYCGVHFIATAHAESVSDLQRRPVYRSLAEMGMFRHIVVMDKKRNLRTERI